MTSCPSKKPSWLDISLPSRGFAVDKNGEVKDEMVMLGKCCKKDLISQYWKALKLDSFLLLLKVKFYKELSAAWKDRFYNEFPAV